MDLTMIALRLVHIFGAVAWTGFTVFLAFFLGPAAAAAGPAGGKVLGALMTKTRLLVAMPLASVATIVSGFILIFKDSAGFDPAWMGSKTGIVYSTAALLGVIAGGLGGHIGGALAAKIGAITRAVEAAGGTPTPEQAADLLLLQQRMVAATRRVAVVLSLALAMMVSARHIFV